MRKVKKTNNEYKKWLFLVIPVIAYFRFFREKKYTRRKKRRRRKKKYIINSKKSYGKDS